jgi:mono/diheme cytochrome c family protein
MQPRSKPWLALALVPIFAGQARAQGEAMTPRATLDRYCVTCHNQRSKTAGLALDTADLANAPGNVELWEKVVRRLRTDSMPPATARQPDPILRDALASSIEVTLDKAAAARPNPGRMPTMHRLSRTEYQNAVRDLLGLTALPKEMDIALLLPADNATSGFDNLADLLFVSPASMDRYLDAARKISRLAVGDPSIPLIVDNYRPPADLPQNVRLEELPVGTRGGVVMRSYVPVDADYVITMELAGAVREPHQIEIAVDGERRQLLNVGARPAPASFDGEPDAASPAPVPGPAPPRTTRNATQDLEVRLALAAGARVIAVTFLEHTAALDEAVVPARVRSRGSLPALARVTLAGPYAPQGPGNTPSRRLIFNCTPTSAARERSCAEKVLSQLVRRAYRRPVEEGDLDELWTFYEAGRKEAGFERGIQRAIERLLVSPQFLFRIERDPDGVTAAEPYRISDLELASRLSFFLWSSIPDDELLILAARGRLKDPGTLEQQARRMLADPRADALVTNFAAQWLYLNDLENKTPDPLLFRDFDQSLRQAFRRETELFVGSIVRDNRSVLELLTANYTFVNERLARHYGIPHVKGSAFRRVTLPDTSMRGGLLGQGSILTLTSYANRTSPVLRGKWVLENILASPPPPPPANVPALKTENESTGRALTMRQAMEQHRASPQCASCHMRMDPLGFSMEHFDAIGRRRERTDMGDPIDASATLPDGTAFEDVSGLRAALLRHPERFATTVTEKLLMYAIGRNLQAADAPAVRAIVRDAARDNYSMASIVMRVVASVPFQMRLSQAPTH